MLATVLITNYDYGRFVGQAIESALGQTHPDVEVVVVDDGSTDESRDVIAGYGDSVVAVLKRNEGQAAAVNAGLERARGEVVCLLDADDLFLPEKVARVVEAWRPDASVVYHPLQAIAEDGTPIAKPSPRSVLRGDIRERVERAGGFWPWPTTTGLSCTRRFLDRVRPLPVLAERVFADAYLAQLGPFHGPVVGIDAVLGLYRVHGANTWSRASLDRDALRARNERLAFEAGVLRAALARTGVRSELSLDRHVRVQQYRWAIGDGVSRARATASTLRCPTLPWPMKWREAVRLNLGRW